MNDEAKPQGTNWLTPYLTVADVDASLAFYEAAFGFAREMTMPGPGGATVHGSMLYQGNFVQNEEAIGFMKGRWHIYPKKVMERMRRRGLKVG